MKRLISALAAMICGCALSLPALAVNTGNQAADIVRAAKSQLGYTGDGKRTKYNRWFYGSDTAAPWCAIFISWCANEADIPNSVIGKNALASGFGVYNMDNNPFGVPAQAFSDRRAQAGDIVFVDNDGDGISNHVGLVSESDGEYIYTVEGNMRDEVKSLRYSARTGYNDYGSARVVFYGVPDYAAEGAGLEKTVGNGFIEIYNSGADIQSATVITVGYEDGKMTGAHMEQTVFIPNETRRFYHGANEKVFVWDGMKPLV